jgi:hypothetical protein
VAPNFIYLVGSFKPWSVFVKALVLAVALSTSFSSLAFAKNISVDCKAPDGLMGNSATMSGNLEIDGEMVTGKLKIFIGGSTQQPVLDGEFRISGAYLEDGAITVLAPDDESINIIYINPNSKDISYVEKDGNQYLSNCAGE